MIIKLRYDYLALMAIGDWVAVPISMISLRRKVVYENIEKYSNPKPEVCFFTKLNFEVKFFLATYDRSEW